MGARLGPGKILGYGLYRFGLERAWKIEIENLSFDFGLGSGHGRGSMIEIIILNPVRGSWF